MNEADILRIAGEPCRYFQETEVHEYLTRAPGEYYRFIKNSLGKLASGEATMEMPPKQIFSDPDFSGDFRVMPCVVRNGTITTKSVKLVGTNILQSRVPGQITVGKAFVIDNEENYISHIFEACLLSSARTAICACLAIDLLGKGYRQLTIIGAGRVGYYCARYALALGLVDSLILADIDQERAESMASILRDGYPGTPITASIYADLADTDIVLLATTSRTGIYSPDHFDSKLVISVGADIDFQHELSPDIAKDANIFVDTLDSCRYGDLKLWIENGLVVPEKITELLPIIVNGPEVDVPGRRVFISTGTALFDNQTMAYIIGEHVK